MQLRLYEARICVLSVATAVAIFTTRYQRAAAKIDLGGPPPRRLLRCAPFQGSVLFTCASLLLACDRFDVCLPACRFGM